MKIYTDIEQGSPAWFQMRLGKPTASCFDQIVTPKKCDLSKSATTYALRLVAERLLNMPTESVEGMEWMERGRELEPMAARQYEFANDVTTVRVGFITTDDGRIGCSPDRLVAAGSQKVGLEIKCPAPHVQLGYLLLGIDADYKPQLQGQILIAELDRLDLYAYHPQMPPLTVQTTRDHDYCAKMFDALLKFCDQVDELEDRARSLGVFQAAQHATSPIEAEALARAYQDETFDRMMRQGFAN